MSRPDAGEVFLPREKCGWTRRGLALPRHVRKRTEETNVWHLWLAVEP
jgi:hypothetical protein